MGTSSNAVIEKRILAASNKSPIAIFKTSMGIYDAVFARTEETVKRIKRHDRNYVGSFYGIAGAESASFLMSR